MNRINCILPLPTAKRLYQIRHQKGYRLCGSQSYREAIMIIIEQNTYFKEMKQIHQIVSLYALNDLVFPFFEKAVSRNKSW